MRADARTVGIVLTDVRIDVETWSMVIKETLTGSQTGNRKPNR